MLFAERHQKRKKEKVHDASTKYDLLTSMENHAVLMNDDALSNSKLEACYRNRIYIALMNNKIWQLVPPQKREFYRMRIGLQNQTQGNHMEI